MRAGGFLEGFARVGFETGDCSGTPWLVNVLPAAAPPFFREAGVGPPNRLYVAAGPRATPTIASTWVIPPGGPAQCQGQEAATEEALPATAVLDLDTFSPPFRIR